MEKNCNSNIDLDDREDIHIPSETSKNLFQNGNLLPKSEKPLEGSNLEKREIIREFNKTITFQETFWNYQSNSINNEKDKVKTQIHAKSLTKITISKLTEQNQLSPFYNQTGINRFKTLVFNPEIKDPIFRNHLSVIIENLSYLQSKIQLPNKKLIDKKAVILPSSTKKLLFFEIDNVLISLKELFTNKSDPREFIKIRPFCIESLKVLSDFYDIYIFSNGTIEFISTIINFLDPFRKIFTGFLSKKHCFKSHSGRAVKDLRICVNKSLNDMIIIDSLDKNFVVNIDNLIPILKWEGDKKDCEMRELLKYLLAIEKYEDVREVNRKHFKLEELINANNFYN